MKTWTSTMITILLLGILSLSACGGAATPVATPVPTQPQPTQAVTTGPVTLKIWHQWDESYLAGIMDLLNAYTQEHPNVTLDISRPDDLYTALTVLSQLGEGPDIVGWGNENIGSAALSGSILPLGDLGIETAFLQSTFEPIAANGVTWQGAIWGLPVSQDGLLIIYNKALASASDFPADPMDLDDLADKAQAYYQDQGLPLFCNPGFSGADPRAAATVFFAFGLPAIVDEQGMVYLESQEAEAAGEWLVSVKPWLYNNADEVTCQTTFLEGRVAAWWTNSSAIYTMEAAGINYGILPMGKPYVSIETFMIGKNALDRGNTTAALDLISYITGAQAQKDMVLNSSIFPVNTAALSDPLIQANPVIAAISDALRQGTPLPTTPYAATQWEPFGVALGLIWNIEQEPAVALSDAQVRIEAAIDLMK